MKNTRLSRITGLLLAGTIALSLSACGNGNDDPATPGATNSAWTDLNKPIDVPADADKLGGADAATEGIKDARNALSALYADRNVTGESEGDVERTAEDFNILYEYTTDDLAKTMKTRVDKAIAGDPTAISNVMTFFPQTRFESTLDLGGERVLDTTTPDKQSYRMKGAVASVTEQNGDVYLNVEFDHVITIAGTLDGKPADASVTRQTILAMAPPTNGGDWKIAGASVNTQIGETP